MRIYHNPNGFTFIMDRDAISERAREATIARVEFSRLEAV
jgi:hypothetical protein